MTMLGRQTQRILGLAAGVGILLSAWPAFAFPDRPLTLVVPFAAGGPADLIGRGLADALGRELNQRVIVENVSGAGGTIGSLRVASAAPDGYTMLLGHIGTHGAAPALYRKLSYDPVTGFLPVGMVASTPMVLVTKNTVGKDGLKSFREFVATRGEKLTFSHGGVGSIAHLGCVMLNKELSIQATAVGYRGNGPALQDLLAGQVDYMCDAVSTAKMHIESGALRAVMMLSNPTGLDPLPAPTARSVGVDVDVVAWYALFMPKATDTKIGEQIQAALDRALDQPSFKTALAKVGTTTSQKSERNGAFVRQLVASQVGKWKQVLEPID